MARLLEVSASGFYAWARRAAAPEPTPRQRRRAALTVRIRATHAGSRGTYGSPRVTAELRARGERVSEKTVASVMAGIGSRASARARSRSGPRCPIRRRCSRRTWWAAASTRAASTWSG
ncbi:transposase [Micromonospora rifamycinica]|uniref:transposase n=1 Tax=Micromonospora rifamycinica TaxID=291594 RepID=UPI0033E0A9B3